MGIVEELNTRSEGALPGLVGLEVLSVGDGTLSGRLELRDELLAPNGYLHAATVVALADTSCGYGTFVNLPEGAEGFTTIELKSNFLARREGEPSSARRGSCTAGGPRRSGTRPLRGPDGPSRSSAARR